MEIQWIGVAFALGFLARQFRQPPLLGFLAAGFILELAGLRPDDSLRELAHVGIQLLLFSIGLKLDLRTVVRPQVWGTTLIQMTVSTAFFGSLALGLGALGVGAFANLDLRTALLLGFVASFASTVFVVKVLEERDDLGAVYGLVAIGILIMEDLAAVTFLAASTGKLPSPWALGLFALIPLRPFVQRALAHIGHGELLVLGGVAASLGGAALFELVGVKGDLGALSAGVLLGGHPKTNELAKSLLGLKDVFLVGFFLSVGLTGLPTVETTLIALGLVALAPLKGALFFVLLTRFRLRARTSLFAASSLTNYSEFGLIVGALSVSQGWLGPEWLVTLATALALSFLVSATINERAYAAYRRFRDTFLRFESRERIPEEESVDVSDATVLVFGMGRVGTGAYDALREHFGDGVVGFDLDPHQIDAHVAAQRRVVLASATDSDFWDRLHVDRKRIQMVLLAMSSHVENRVAIKQLRAEGYAGLVAATARYPDELDELRACGADVAYHVLAESGPGFVRHSLAAFESHDPARAAAAAAAG
jgi:glutathione-regulated potassium-efflux system ancillary protein KefC